MNKHVKEAVKKSVKKSVRESVKKLIHVCHWCRDICQFIEIKSITKSRVKVLYCVPFQKGLQYENDFRNIVGKFFQDIRIKKLPDGMSSGMYEIDFDYSSCDTKDIDRFILDLEIREQNKLDMRNKRDKENREFRIKIVEQQLEPIYEEIRVLQEKTETNDKQLYHYYMTQIETLQKKCSLIRTRAS